MKILSNIRTINLLKKKYEYLFKKYCLIRNRHKTKSLTNLTYRNFIKEMKNFDNFL